MKLRKIALAVGLLGLTAMPLVAAGMWFGLPIIGGSSYCGGSNFAGSGTITTTNCTTTVPAGPTAVTGAELVPVDTQLASGAAPQTAYLPVPLAASGLMTVVIPTTGASVTIPNNTTNYYVDGLATLSSLTITMPASPKQGQLVRIGSRVTISSLTLSPNTGQLMHQTPTALTVSTTASYGYEFAYYNGYWMRLQ